MTHMTHPKMQYTYVGIDSHKDTHTAVFLDCFFDKLGEITFENLPSQFGGFLHQAQRLRLDGTTLLFGLEDISSYGRHLVQFLKSSDQQVKHVNAFLVAQERRNQNITQKSDSVDAECAARVLLSKFGELPDAQPDDTYWTLRTLVARRDFLVRQNASAKNYLHSLLTQHYPNYRRFFYQTDSKTALAFFMMYPSPSKLNSTTVEELTAFLGEVSAWNCGRDKALEILSGLQDTAIRHQESHDMVVQSTIRQIQFNKAEIERVEARLPELLTILGSTLTSMAGIDTVSAAQLMACIGNIKKFSSPAKLARYAGIAPVTYASGKKDAQFANKRGNRELNSLFFNLAVRLSYGAGPTRKVINSFFHEYYQRKISEGKTKRQALKCVQRRLVNIIWTMLTHNEEYVNPPTFDTPDDGKQQQTV